MLTFGGPSSTEDRPVAQSLPKNDCTNTETEYSYIYALNGIRNQEPNVVVPVTYDGQPEVLTPRLFMINRLLKIISFLETVLLRNSCKFTDSISAGDVRLCSTAIVFALERGFAREYFYLEGHQLIVEVPMSRVFPSRNLF